MDFAFSETQQTLSDLSAGIFGAGSLTDDALWRAAGDAGLLSVLVPEELGGPGLGMADACVVAGRCGSAGLTLPIGNAIVAHAALADLGTAADDLAVFTPLGHGGADPSAGRPTVDPNGRISGGPFLAPADARQLLFWATVDGRDAGVLLDVTEPEVARREVASASGRFSTYSISNAAVATAEIVVGERARELRHRTWQRGLLLGCAELGGLADAALRLTAAYAAQRRQFNRPIGTFQAVSGRLADCYIDVEAMQWTMWRAAESFDSGRHSDELLAIARVLACQGGDRVLAAAQHIHGGLGVDVSYPLHTYFLRTRHLLLAAGGAERHLSDLGASLALEAEA